MHQYYKEKLVRDFWEISGRKFKLLFFCKVANLRHLYKKCWKQGKKNLEVILCKVHKKAKFQTVSNIHTSKSIVIEKLNCRKGSNRNHFSLSITVHVL